MARLILLNKPFRVLSQFSPSENKQTLADYLNIPEVYPAGRLDWDSEGLLLLTDSGSLQHRISHPKFAVIKTYYAQVEGVPDKNALTTLQKGVALKDGLTLPANATLAHPPRLWDRSPPIRERQNIPTTWLRLTISEGRNRQVRRMTAAVGHPTLRLIRFQVGPWHLGNLAPGQWQQEEVPIEKIRPYSRKTTPTSRTRKQSAKKG